MRRRSERLGILPVRRAHCEDAGDERGRERGRLAVGVVLPRWRQRVGAQACLCFGNVCRRRGGRVDQWVCGMRLGRLSLASSCHSVRSSASMRAPTAFASVRSAVRPRSCLDSPERQTRGHLSGASPRTPASGMHWLCFLSRFGEQHRHRTANRLNMQKAHKNYAERMREAPLARSLSKSVANKYAYQLRWNYEETRQLKCCPKKNRASHS